MSSSDREAKDGRTSVRIEPFWLNPATIKGTTTIAVGSFVLFAPEISARLLSLTIGVALIVAGVSDIRFPGRSGKGARRRRLEGVLSIAGGASFRSRSAAKCSNNGQ